MLPERLRRLLFGDIERELELADDDQAGLGQHPLEGGRDPLDLLGIVEIPNDLSHLEDVAAVDLLSQNLVPAAPVGSCFLRLAAQRLKDLPGLGGPIVLVRSDFSPEKPREMYKGRTKFSHM